MKIRKVAVGNAAEAFIESHTPSKILDGAFVESFVALLNDLSIEI